MTGKINLRNQKRGKITRRDFIKGSIATGAVLLTPYSHVLGANDDIRMAVIGMGSNGQGHVRRYRKMPGVRLVAVCEVDQRRLSQVVQNLTADKEKVRGYTDIRKLLEDKEVDAVTISTPNHWHALAAIWACQAGKDVKVEKPVSHNIWEGRKIVEAARKYRRIVQAGTESRSDPALQQVFEYLQQGNLGKILVARGFCWKRRKSIGQVRGPQPVPESVNYDLWSGPAAKSPLMRKNLHYDWHWVWPTGNGDIGNQGAHEMDMCRWALGQEKLPPRVISIGGRFGYIDDGETANTQVALLDYQPAPIIFEVRGLPRKAGDSRMDTFRGVRVGIVIQCEHGYFAGGASGGWLFDNDGKKIKQFSSSGGGAHSPNFLKAIRSRKISDLNADIEQGHTSAALSHMANISHRIGQDSSRDQIREVIKGNKEMIDAFERFQEHLLVNKVNIHETPRILGPALTMNTEKERFVGDFADQANALLRRDYRVPFVVPEVV
jgi:predicted dehydrogenase